MIKTRVGQAPTSPPATRGATGPSVPGVGYLEAGFPQLLPLLPVGTLAVAIRTSLSPDVKVMSVIDTVSTLCVSETS